MAKASGVLVIFPDGIQIAPVSGYVLLTEQIVILGGGHDAASASLARHTVAVKASGFVRPPHDIEERVHEICEVFISEIKLEVVGIIWVDTQVAGLNIAVGNTVNEPAVCDMLIVNCPADKLHGLDHFDSFNSAHHLSFLPS